MCHTEALNDVMIEKVLDGEIARCRRCRQNLTMGPKPSFGLHCRLCGETTPLARTLNGSFSALYQQLHDGRTPKEDQQRFCRTGAHKIFAVHHHGQRLHYCPLCGQDLEEV